MGVSACLGKAQAGVPWRAHLLDLARPKLLTLPELTSFSGSYFNYVLPVTAHPEPLKRGQGRMKKNYLNTCRK